MRLLVLTQTVNVEDPVLGFLHGWLTEFSKNYEHISVICLKEGKHTLPKNVSVYSLGKERGASRIQYLWRYYKLIWSLRSKYDAVFVHMNPEYVVLGGLLWKILGKRAFMWRNHYAGGIVTRLAIMLADKTFCTSRHSFTARYRKNRLMPVGIDTDLFAPVPGIPRTMSILSLGRVAPSKRLDVLVEALTILKEKGSTISVAIYGDALPRDRGYRDKLVADVEARGLSSHIRFHSGVPNGETPRLYSAHEIFVNCSQSGMYDKTIFEAAACGALSLAASRDYTSLVGEQFSFVGSSDLANKIQNLIALPQAEKDAHRTRLRGIVREHSLEALAKKLFEEIR